MSDLLSWLWEHITEVSILLGGIGSLAGYYFSHWKAELADPASLEKLRSYLDDSPWRTAYRHMLGRALNAADQFFGPPMSLRAYSVCLTLAFFCPIALFFLTWVLRGAHTLGTLELLPKGWSLSGRITLFAGVLLAAGMFWALIIHSDRVVARVEGAMARLIPQRAYQESTYEAAKERLTDLHAELQQINRRAARSLQEGLEETLTLHRLGLFDELGKSLSGRQLHREPHG
jgi:hypothetical protein